MQEQFTNLDLNADFSKLYFDLVSSEKEKRPTFEEILNYKWMEDIKNLNQEEIKQLEEEIKNIFINSESKDQEIKNQKIESKRIFHDEVDNNIKRSSSEEFKFKFNDKLKPKYLESEKGIKNYIIISGGFLIPVEFMNYLIYEISKIL